MFAQLAGRAELRSDKVSTARWRQLEAHRKRTKFPARSASGRICIYALLPSPSTRCWHPVQLHKAATRASPFNADLQVWGQVGQGAEYSYRHHSASRFRLNACRPPSEHAKCFMPTGSPSKQTVLQWRASSVAQ